MAASPAWMLDHADGVFATHPATRWRVLPGERGDQAAFSRAEKAGWAGRLEALDFSGFDQLAGSVVRFFVGADLGRVRELDLPCGRAVLGMRHALLRSTPVTDRLDVLRLDGDGEWVDFRDLAAALAPARLTELALPNAGLTDGGLRTLLRSPACRDLARLDVSDNPLGEGAADALREAPCRLRRLDLAGVEFGYGIFCRTGSADALADLRALDLSRCYVGRRFGPVVMGLHLEELGHSRFWRQAEELRLADFTAPRRGFSPLHRGADPENVRLLDLSDTEATGVPVRCADTLEWLSLARTPAEFTGRRGDLPDDGGYPRLRTLHLGAAVGPGGDPQPDGDRVVGRLLEPADRPRLPRLRLLTLNGRRLTAGAVDGLLHGPYWRLSGLGLGWCDLPATAARVLAGSPRLARLDFLDLSHNPWLGENVLLPLAESPHLCPLLELDIRGVPASDRVRQALRERLGRRLSE